MGKKVGRCRTERRTGTGTLVPVAGRDAKPGSARKSGPPGKRRGSRALLASKLLKVGSTSSGGVSALPPPPLGEDDLTCASQFALWQAQGEAWWDIPPEWEGGSGSPSMK